MIMQSSTLSSLSAIGDALGEEDDGALHEARVRREVQEHRVSVVEREQLRAPLG